MKLYVWVDNEIQFIEFCSFLTENNLYKAEYFRPQRCYEIDTIVHDIDDIDKDKVPHGCLLAWDYDYITKMYKGEVIGRFNQGKLQWTLMDSKAMEPMIQVLMYGLKKYDRGNWQKACPKRLDLMDSLQRHSMKIIAGESVDPESGLPHIGHLMCNAMFYSYWEQKTNGQFENFVDFEKVE